MKAYPKYRDSGVPWLGEVPEHWESHRAKFLFKKMSRPVREGDNVVTCFRDGTVTLRKNRRTSGFTESLKEIGYQGIRKGDLIIHQMDAFAGASGVSDSDGKGTPVYLVCYPRRELEPEYFAHLVREMARNKYILSLAKGIRERSTDFRFDAFGAQLLPFPLFAEQQQISRYLDWQSSKIDKFIKAKKKLIALLKEQKQNIINEAVTKGINPDAPMKDSGIEWLGEIPEHWEVKKLKIIAKVKASGIDKHTKENETPVRLCNYTDVYKNNKITDKIDFMKATATKEEIRGFELIAGDVIITKDSETWDDIAVPAHVPDSLTNVICAYHLSLIRPTDELIKGEFLCYSFLASSIAYQFKLTTTGVTRFGLSKGAIKNARFVVPPTDEQQQIVAHIEKETALIDKTITRTKREIELITEYRSRLVSDVVTGKIDVRDSNIPQLLGE